MPARRVLLTLALILSGLAALPSGAGASGRPAFIGQRVADPVASRRAWTVDRMRAAAPAPMPVIQPDDLQAETPAMGEPQVISGTSKTREEWYATGDGSETWASRRPIPFTREEVLDPSAFPFAAHGMIFGSSPMGDFACSGTAVTSDNKSVVWTAGHCLHLGGQMSAEVVFVPGYEKEDLGEEDAMEETAPYGVWPADLLMVPPQWQRSEDPLYDFGALRTVPDSTGALLGDVVAARGIAFNQHPTETLRSFGYPGMPTTKFDGDHLQSCLSQGSGRIWDGMMAMGCDMEQGSSGGGWVMRDEFVTSNVSGGNMRVWPNMAFGPYLGTAAKALYDEIRGGTATFPQPTPSSPVEATPKTHRMKITLNLRDHLVASGRVTASDGFSACVSTAPVRLGKKRSDGVYYPVGKLLFTDATGRFKTQLRDAKGSYIAIVEESAYDLSHRCAQAINFDTHRH